MKDSDKSLKLAGKGSIECLCGAFFALLLVCINLVEAMETYYNSVDKKSVNITGCVWQCKKRITAKTKVGDMNKNDEIEIRT